MKIKASFRYNLTTTPGNDCRIQKAVELSPDDFFQLQIGPLQEMPFISENKDCMFEDGSIKHCLLALEQGGLDGVLIQSTGPDYPGPGGGLHRPAMHGELRRRKLVRPVQWPPRLRPWIRGAP